MALHAPTNGNREAQSRLKHARRSGINAPPMIKRQRCHNAFGLLTFPSRVIWGAPGFIPGFENQGLDRDWPGMDVAKMKRGRPLREKADATQPALAAQDTNAHRGCTTKWAWLVSNDETTKQKVTREAMDGKYRCPKCEERYYCSTEIKIHYKECNATVATSSGASKATSKPKTPGQAVPSITSMEIEENDDEETKSQAQHLPQPTHHTENDATRDNGPLEQQEETEQTAQPAQSDTIQPEMLRQYGLVINTKFNIIICIDHKGIIKPKEIRQHFIAHHSEFPTPRDLQEKLEAEILHKFPQLTYTPSHPTQPIEAIYGLAPPEANYRRCLTCYHCYASHKTFAQHTCMNAIEGEQKTAVQRFIDNTSSPWFAVRETLPAGDPDDAWVIYRRNPPSRPEATDTFNPEDNHRVLHQFLYRERWLERVSDQQHEELMTLASYSTQSNIYGTLHKHIHAFLSNAQDLTTRFYLRRLISLRPSEETDETKFRHHRIVNYETHQAYARIVAGLIAFIHRSCEQPSDLYPMAIPNDIANGCKNLISTLTEPASNDEEDNNEGGEGVAGDTDDESDVSDEEGKERGLHSTYARAPPPTTASVQECLTHLLYLLYTQEPSNTNRGDFFSPIRHYVLISSLRKSGQWAAAGLITHNIAALLFTGRLIFAWKTAKISQKENITTADAFKHTQKYLLEETESVMPNLYLLKRGLASLNTAEQTTISFNAPDMSGKSAIIGTNMLELDKIGQLHCEAIKDITSAIDKLTFSNEKFAIPADQFIHDDPRQCEADYSFTTDPRNSWNDRPTLVQHIIQTPQLFSKYAYWTPSGTIAWKPAAIAVTLKRIYDVQIKILCNIILSYGEPARATEIASHLLVNIRGGTIRNLFIIANQVVLRASYNKTSSAQGSDKTICRIPLPEIGRQFIRYLVFLRPLYAEWQLILRPHMEKNTKYYLFAGLHRALTAHDISQALGHYTKKNLDITLNIRTYRQFMAFVTTTNNEVFAAIDVGEGGTHHQFGHSADINTKHYGHDSRTPEGMNMKTFLADARVSGVFHALYGHKPTLLEDLERGTGRKADIIAMINKIRNRTPSDVFGNRYEIDAQTSYPSRDLLIDDIALGGKCALKTTMSYGD
ncbi:hypothetical protein P691DRAFT_820577 [Macrolepiota fuliginosa MF-IS2]|uniref:C2H2-type domain-containing protein n=1 Tax=Macrolepiota fuliginosa MF-IS2 TaxID=1400762 RepID=A0A9P6BUQ8_9AGAR|nr:hypothetical protein P691DRAFT_820577 [Macrolepiota fuliginosa MF-IS2]